MVLRTDFTGENLFLKGRFIKFADYLSSARNVNNHQLCMVGNRLELIEHFPICRSRFADNISPADSGFRGEIHNRRSKIRNPKSQTHR